MYVDPVYIQGVFVGFVVSMVVLLLQGAFGIVSQNSISVERGLVYGGVVVALLYGVVLGPFLPPFFFAISWWSIALLGVAVFFVVAAGYLLSSASELERDDSDGE